MFITNGPYAAIGSSKGSADKIKTVASFELLMSKDAGFKKLNDPLMEREKGIGPKINTLVMQEMEKSVLGMPGFKPEYFGRQPTESKMTG